MIELPDMTFEEAEKLWEETDYAFDATHQDKYPIHGPDAAAFFLEGYLYARKRLQEMQTKIALEQLNAQVERPLKASKGER